MLHRIQRVRKNPGKTVKNNCDDIFGNISDPLGNCEQIVCGFFLNNFNYNVVHFAEHKGDF